MIKNNDQLTFGGDLSPLGFNKIDTSKARSGKALKLNVPINGTGANLPFYVADQLSFQFNKIKLNKTIFLAPKGKHVDKKLVVEYESFIDLLVDDLKIYLNKDRFREKNYRICLRMVLANLLAAKRRRAQVVIPLGHHYSKDEINNPAKITDRTTKAICEFLSDKGFIYFVTGKDNSIDGNSSWIAPLMPLIAFFEKHKALIKLHQNTIFAVVRDKIKNDKPISKNRNTALKFKRLEKPAREHNEKWLDHTATFNGEYVLPWLRRIFNLNFNLGGRFYGDYQQLSSEERRRILIDGEQTIEPDFKSLHFYLLYAQEGLQLVGDPYQVEGYDRKTIKKVCLQLVNVTDLSSFKACITRSGNPEIRTAHKTYLNESAIYQDAVANNLKARKPSKPRSLEGFIEGLPEGVKGGDLINDILERHKPIAHNFGGENIGLRLQKLDSEVMAETLMRLTDIPCLPVHDSIRCKVSDCGLVIDAMKDAYNAVTGFECLIDSSI